MEENTSTNKKIFNQRIDIYGQALAIYVFVFIIFSVIYGTLHDGEFKIVFSPLVAIMFGIICVGSVMLLLAAIKRKQIIIENNIVEIKNRFRNIKFDVNDISKFAINKSPSGVIKEDACFVRIKLKRKKKFMLIRIASFNEHKKLLACFESIRAEFLENKKIEKEKHTSLVIERIPSAYGRPTFTKGK